MPKCRSCESENVRSFLDLGSMPLSDGLRRPEDVQRTEQRYPLEVVFCGECTLVQILEQVDPEELSCRDYPYYSSFTDSLLRHSKANVEELIELEGLTSDSLVIELASNDGYLLQYFVERGIPVLGIDPAGGPARVAMGKGISTINDFFTIDLARALRKEGKQADVIVGNNVLAHVPDLNGFVAGIAILLEEHGTTSIEAPYVRDLIDGCQFDTIYHEHLCYYSVTAVRPLFARHGLHLNRVVHLPIHGGSLRYYASPTKNPDGSVECYLEEESRRGLTSFDYYADFAERVHELETGLDDLVTRIKAKGGTIGAYGAASKGAIMLNHAGLDGRTLDFVVDRNTHKQGKFLPGVDLEILDPAVILERMPDYLLILPWNFKEEIMEQQAEYQARGGKFIIPVPSPHIVESIDVHGS